MFCSLGPSVIYGPLLRHPLPQAVASTARVFAHLDKVVADLWSDPEGYASNTQTLATAERQRDDGAEERCYVLGTHS